MSTFAMPASFSSCMHSVSVFDRSEGLRPRAARLARQGAWTSPRPTSSKSRSGSVRADFTIQSTTSAARNGRPCRISFSAQRAATPATCGVAMLVPLIITSPSPRPADQMSTPGRRAGPRCWRTVQLCKGSASRPRSSPIAATERNRSAAAGGASVMRQFGLMSRRLSFPAAATTTAPCITPSRPLMAWDRRSNRRTFARYPASAIEVASR